MPCPPAIAPITLLNMDCKLAVVSRIGPLFTGVVNVTQTGFLLTDGLGTLCWCTWRAEITYLEGTQQPGVMLFLEFDKAFDRLDRAWKERCMAAVDFGPGPQDGCATCTQAHLPGLPERLAHRPLHSEVINVQGQPLFPRCNMC